jgi:3-hydroxyacyl-[acyl-carrier-protein] dehydratase
METLRLDHQGLLEYQKNRPPYLLMDVAEEIIPGVSAKGYKDLTEKEWFFACHFPGDPNMPGLLQIEALVQMGALCVLTLPGNKGKVAYLVSANNIKLVKKIVIGDRLNLETKLLSWKRGVAQCSGVGSVNGVKACQAEFTLVLPDIINQYKIQAV